MKKKNDWDNGRDSVSNHQPHDCFLNRLFRRRSKETSKLRVTGLCAGKSPGPVNSSRKWPVTLKMFPFDDVIMTIITVIQKRNGCQGDSTGRLWGLISSDDQGNHPNHPSVSGYKYDCYVYHLHNRHRLIHHFSSLISPHDFFVINTLARVNRMNFPNTDCMKANSHVIFNKWY